MFFKTTISEISNTNPLFNFRNNSTTEYVFNARYLSNILNNNGGSSFVLINDYDRRGRDIYFESSTSVVDIIDEMDSPSANGYYTLNYFKNDNPAKAVLNRDIPIDHIIALFAYWNPSYTWLVFDSYNDYRRVLINDTLDDIFTELTTATTTLATTTLITTTVATTTLITTTVATTTPIPTTTGVTTTAGPTTTFAGTTYYVSNTGSDSADGLTPATAWQTVAKVNASTFDPDTQILFKCGDTWRETLEVPSAGTSGQYLYFGNYGTGSNPRILGSKATTTWADQGSNIWKTDITFVNPRSLYPNYADIVFNVGGAERFGVYQANTASLNTEFEWTWSSNYIYIYSTSDPATAYTGIEVPQRRFCVSTNDNSYLHFDGIDAYYSADVGYDSNNDHTVSDQHGCIIENCEIKFIGGVSTGAYQFGFGIAIAYSNLTIRNCEIHHIGRRGISINMEYTASPYTVHDILIENNIFHHGSHTTSLDMTVNNGGSSSSIDGVVFRNNLIYETNGASVNYPSVQMWYQSYTGTGTIDNVYIYNNIFKYWRDNCLSLESRRIENVYIYNNTFYENNSVGGYYGTSYCINADTDSNNVLRLHLRNNIFYTTFPNDTGGNGALLVMYLVNLGNQDIDYDLYYRINNSVRIMLLNGTSYYMNTAFPTPEGYETHGIKDNPDFVVGSAYRLQATSPAIGTGVHTGSVTYDYDGELRNNPPCIGADEYSAATTAAPTTTAVTTTLVTTTPAPTTTPAATTTPAPTTTSATTTTSAGTTTAGSTTSTTTTTTTMEPVYYTDNFDTYPTGVLAGNGNWIACLNTMQIVNLYSSNRISPNTSNANCIAIYDAPISNNQSAQLICTTVWSGNYFIGVGVRLSGSGATACGYGYMYSSTTSYLYRMDNGVRTILGSTGGGNTDGDIIKLSITGNTLTAYKNGDIDTRVGTNGQATDATYPTGKIGVVGYNTTAGYANGDNFIGEGFEAGTTTASTTTTVVTTTPAPTTTYHTTTYHTTTLATTTAATTTSAGTTTAGSTTSTTTTTTTSGLEFYTDDFSAYNTGDLAGQGDWLTCLNQIAVVAGARVQANSSGNDNCVKLNLPFSDDHYAQITNVQMAAGGGTMGVSARCSGSGATATYYVFEYTNTDGYFGKVVNGSYTTLAESTRNGLAKDVLKIAVEGTSIKLYLNGSLDTTFGSGQNGCTGNQGSYTDSSISTGVPGIAGWSNLKTQGDNFEASDIA